jgi:uncharacterized protein
MPYVFVPGYGNSLDGHWQRYWYQQLANSHWAELGAKAKPEHIGSWEQPDRALWVERLQQCLGALHEPVVLISHSLGGLTIAHWAQQFPAQCARIKAAWLVAVPDPERPNFPADIHGYATVPLAPLPFPSYMVISSNDPYATPQRSALIASAWGAQTWQIGAAGHINVDAGYGPWLDGFEAMQQWQSENRVDV